MAVNYPIALDSGFTIWRAFNNSYWPARRVDPGWE
jgi:hypothetical protein